MRVDRAGVVVLAAVVGLACADRREGVQPSLGGADCSALPSGSGTGQVSAALQPSSPDPKYLGVGVLPAGALARVLARSGEVEAAVCVATIVDEVWALTAAHCVVPGADLSLDFGASRLPVEIASTHVHPVLDLALLQLTEGVPSTVPLTAFDPRVAHLDRATVATVDVDAAGCPETRFLVSRVVDTSTDTITIDGHGRGGACAGDSGSPLFIRDEQGQVVVAGVLSRGSATCTGVDEFVRLAPAAVWLRQLLPERAPATTDCGSISKEGRCFGTQSVWCDQAVLRAEVCADQSDCGWDSDARAYRCVNAPSCAGDAFGRCTQGAAVACERGVVELSACSVTGGCGVDPLSGRVDCDPRANASPASAEE